MGLTQIMWRVPSSSLTGSSSGLLLLSAPSRRRASQGSSPSDGCQDKVGDMRIRDTSCLRPIYLRVTDASASPQVKVMAPIAGLGAMG